MALLAKQYKYVTGHTIRHKKGGDLVLRARLGIANERTYIGHTN